MLLLLVDPLCFIVSFKVVMNNCSFTTAFSQCITTVSIIWEFNWCIQGDVYRVCYSIVSLANLFFSSCLLPVFVAIIVKCSTICLSFGSQRAWQPLNSVRILERYLWKFLQRGYDFQCRLNDMIIILSFSGWGHWPPCCHFSYGS